jgi:WhiB family redox-sensing transcriptional regulator
MAAVELLDDPPALAALLALFGAEAEQREGWRREARCRGWDVAFFFPARGTDTTEQRRVCEGCPVREPCLDYALTASSEFKVQGIWGGVSSKQRRRARRNGWTAEQLLEHLGG